MSYRLSLLIPTIHTRRDLLARLLDGLRPQVEARAGEVELLIDADHGDVSIGAKRNDLLDRAIGDYVAYIDDDDTVAPDYVARILTALESSPDCVGFNVTRMWAGAREGVAIHSIRFDKYTKRRVPGVRGNTIYERTPNHLSPVRRELAQRVRFPEQNVGEDTDYAKRLRPLLQTEEYIDRELYCYWYRPDHQRAGEVTNRSRGGAA